MCTHRGGSEVGVEEHVAVVRDGERVSVHSQLKHTGARLAVMLLVTWAEE